MRPAFVSLALLAGAAYLAACSAPGETHTRVSLRVFDIEGEPLERARIRFLDAGGDAVGTGLLHRDRGFRFESETLAEDGDWGRRVRSVDVETRGCASRGDPVTLRESSIRVAAGGHPSLRSKRIDRYEVRATLICVAPLGEEERRRTERALREGDVRDRIRAAVALGWFRAPAEAGDALREAMRDAAAIALRVVHHPDPAALPALVDALGDPREPVRFAAATLLARLGRNEHGVAAAGLPALEKRRDDPSEPVRLVAEYAIARITPR